MRFEEVIPHLNKIATLYLKNNKRKVGWVGDHPVRDSSAISSIYAERVRQPSFKLLSANRLAFRY